MSLAITHFVIGAGLTALLVHLAFPWVRYRQTWIILGGIWALVPDLHYISPVFTDELAGIKSTVFGDVFWFHAFLDGLYKTDNSRELAGVTIAFFLVVTFLLEFREDESSWRPYDPVPLVETEEQ